MTAMTSENGVELSVWSTAWSNFLSVAARWLRSCFHSSVDLLGEVGILMSPLSPDRHWLALDVDGVDDGAAFLPHELELALTAHLHVELLLLLLLLGVLLGLGGPGTRASALMRAICDHTAVTSRNATRHSRKSMNGISGISWLTRALAAVSTACVNTSHALL